MENLLRSLNLSAADAIGVLAFLLAACLAAIVYIGRKQVQAAARWKNLLAEAKGENIERLLTAHLRERLQQQASIDDLLERTALLEDKMQTAKRFVGLVKYDAFPDVGGQQSFALALFDDQGNGAVVSSIVGRSDCRVYCKPLHHGRSERGLSQEEQRAIMEAASGGPKAIISK